MTRYNIARILLVTWLVLWLLRAAIFPGANGELLFNVASMVGVSAWLGYWSKR